MLVERKPVPAIFFGLCALACVAAPGCRDARDPNTCWVSGSAMYDGQPIVNGLLTFEPENARIGPACCKFTDGRFKMRAPKGGHVVRIEAFQPASPPPANPQDSRPDGKPPAPTEPPVQYLPARYNMASTLRVEVKKSGEKFTFDLDSKPDPKKPDPKKR
jgi:hypothetical protein